MLRDFLFDVLLLRQGRKVSESAAHMHSLPLTCEAVASWTAFLTCSAPRDDFMLLGADRQAAQRRFTEEIALHERLLAEAGETKASTLALEQTAQVLRVVAATLGARAVLTDYETEGAQGWAPYCASIASCLDAACEAKEQLGTPDFCPAQHGVAIGEALYSALITEEYWMLLQNM